MKCFSPAVIFSISLLGLALRISAAERPNFVIVLADDLGYGEPEVHTPNLDQFAQEGVRLTHCYSAAANCSPSRTGLMTGRNPFRVGIHNWIHCRGKRGQQECDTGGFFGLPFGR